MRIVFGTGNNRREITGEDASLIFNDLSKFNAEQAMQRHIARMKLKTKVPSKQEVSNKFKAKEKKILDKCATSCHEWGLETVAEIQNLLDYFDITDTGNLKKSFRVLSETYDSKSGMFNVIIGVNNQPGEHGIKAPPFWLGGDKGGPSRYGHKKGPHKGEREMPSENYAPYVIGPGGKHEGFMEIVTSQTGGSARYRRRTGNPYIMAEIKRVMVKNAKKIIKGKL